MNAQASFDETGKGDPAPVLAQHPHAEIRETHSAIVLLAGDRAYKIKKPVNLGFLDFRDEHVRREVCRREVELNRRLAPDVYLDTLTFAGSDGHPYEHGVLMRRMPDALRLSTMVEQGLDVEGHLRALAKLLAGFHASADRGPQIAAEGRVGGLWRRWVNNLRETEVFRGTILAPALHDRIRRLALRYVDGRGALLADRAAAGLIVDGHGDLIAEDIFCLPDYPRVLDCLEFDDLLRWVDVLDDAAFLAMDLEHLDRPDLAAAFLRDYLEFSGTPTVASLQHHYTAYRAFVRAKVACIQATQGRPGATADADRYANLALRHLEAGDVTLTLVGGAPGTGKTTLAQRLADRLGAVWLSSDTVRRELRADAGERYSDTAKAATYRELLLRARCMLQHGESVIADATWADDSTRGRAADVAAETASRLIALECQLPIETAASRAQRRLEHGEDLSEAGSDVARQLAAARSPWPSADPVATSGSIEDSLRIALTALETAKKS
jgi:aminoglycoside phosphotransferase family enzyme/predicted kinase